MVSAAFLALVAVGTLGPSEPPWVLGADGLQGLLPAFPIALCNPEPIAPWGGGGGA